MEEKKSIRPHSITWKDRKKGEITGVKDVISFDDEAVILETEQGMLTIKGKKLHVARLSLDQGEIDMEGEVSHILYSGSNPAKKGSLAGRLFR